jgi:hypothetical protein
MKRGKKQKKDGRGSIKNGWFQTLPPVDQTSGSIAKSVPRGWANPETINHMTRTHHSTMDSIDYVPADDLKTSGFVLAALIYDAANDPAMVPRKPATPASPGSPK